MALRIEQPPLLTGDAAAQLRTIHGYLYRMAETLNIALESSGSTVVVKPTAVQTSPGNAENLRGLIVNTATVLRREMDTLEQTLRGSVEAVSEQWGAYREEMVSTVTATAEAVVQQYGFVAEIEALQQQAAGFERYRVQTEGYIRQGFLERNENGVPIIGIAIGQGLTGTETVVNGQTLLQLDTTQNCAFYTAERVSFRIGGREVAYISGRRLYIHDAEIGSSLSLGGKWLMESGRGLTVKWIG